MWGLILLGFTSLYREGFEVVLFLQSYNLRLGGAVVLKGALLGLVLSAMVAVLTFVLQQRLPYRKMLITTGVLLGVVLLVMVGEQAQEMQLAHWISKTDVPWLTGLIPAWLGMWFAVFPTYETLIAQLLAAIVVIGSYFAARRVRCTAEPDALVAPPPADSPAEVPSILKHFGDGRVRRRESLGQPGTKAFSDRETLTLALRDRPGPWSQPTPAGVRHFTFLYEATTSAPGSLEMENSITFRTGSDGDRFSQVDFRHEFEFGVTRHFQPGVYVADWNYHSGFSGQRDGYAYSGTAVEAIYNLSNPVTDPVGISIYEELKGGDRFFESESKIILQKFSARSSVTTPRSRPCGMEMTFGEREGEFQQAVGLSYEFAPSFSAGIEMLHEIVLPDWSNAQAVNNFFIGPNVSVRQGQWFATVTALAQATQTSDEPGLQVRTIVGYAF